MDKNTATPRVSEELCLTNIRTFQQYKRSKSRYGQPSRQLTSPPHFCNKIKSVFIKTDNHGIPCIVRSSSIPCNLWSCPTCGIRKAKKLRKLLINIIQINNLCYMYTITLDPFKIPTSYLERYNSTGNYLSFLLNKYMLHIKRLMKKQIKYVWVKEFQKNTGNAHLHMMINTYLPMKALRHYFVKIGGGAQMKIEKAKSIKAVSIYFTKYITKMVESNQHFTVGERRYSISQSCLRPTKLTVNKITLKQLFTLLPHDKFFLVYNLLTNSKLPDKEIILYPYQDKLNI